MQSCISEEAGLLHNPEELLLADLAIPIPVRLINHFLRATLGFRVQEGAPLDAHMDS